MRHRDQRKSERYYGQIPVELKQGTGLTRNCSVDGIYFMTDQQLTVGEQIELVLLLDHAVIGRSMRLRCSGKVIRLETEREQTGVAVSFCSHLLEAAPYLAAA